jgi:hypothetical protein
MNINDVLIRVLNKVDQTSEQILHQNEEPEEKHDLEIIARDREIAKKFQEEWEEEHGLEIIAREAREARDREMAEKFQLEWEEEHGLEIIAREARDRKIAEKFHEEWEETRRHALEITGSIHEPGPVTSTSTLPSIPSSEATASAQVTAGVSVSIQVHCSASESPIASLSIDFLLSSRPQALIVSESLPRFPL